MGGRTAVPVGGRQYGCLNERTAGTTATGTTVTDRSGWWAGVRGVAVHAAVTFVVLLVALAAVLAVRMAWEIGSRPTSGLAELVGQGDLLLSALSFVASLVLVGTTIVYAYGNHQIVRETRRANELNSEAFAAADGRARTDEVRTHLSHLVAATADLVRHSTDYAQLRPLRVWAAVPGRTAKLWRAGEGMRQAISDANVAGSRLRMCGDPILTELTNTHLDAVSRFDDAVRCGGSTQVGEAVGAMGESSRRLEQHTTDPLST